VSGTLGVGPLVPPAGMAAGDPEVLRAGLRALDRVVVAFSGGADSAFLARMAHDTLGPERAVAVTAVSPSLAADERADCAVLAAEWGLQWIEVVTDEMTRAAYRRNDGDRCYWCKDALMDALAPLVSAGGAWAGATVVLGVNVDDLGDHRPGQRAAAERGARFPLVEAGFTKADVRAHSRRLGLRTWDKPAAACLASRLPYGTPVSVPVLGRIDRAEAALHALGFPAVRVRHYGDTARVEVPLADLPALLAERAEVVAAVKGAGYRYVTVDLEGLRSGNLNAALPARPRNGARGGDGGGAEDGGRPA
jgi:pyridinium-3,5-biscarboxylic acid mononucleotide sulfurtransferase